MRYEVKVIVHTVETWLIEADDAGAALDNALNVQASEWPMEIEVTFMSPKSVRPYPVTEKEHTDV